VVCLPRDRGKRILGGKVKNLKKGDRSKAGGKVKSPTLAKPARMATRQVYSVEGANAVI
jgi:hypothetical protein